MTNTVCGYGLFPCTRNFDAYYFIFYLGECVSTRDPFSNLHSTHKELEDLAPVVQRADKLTVIRSLNNRGAVKSRELAFHALIQGGVAIISSCSMLWRLE